MSTPVRSNTPPKIPRHKRTPTNELQEQMQQMIRLQNEQQKRFQADTSLLPPAPPHIPKQQKKKEATSATTSATTSSNQILTATKYEDDGDELRGLLQFPDDPDVGQGTLLFPPGQDFHRPKARTASSDTSLLMSLAAVEDSALQKSPEGWTYGSVEPPPGHLSTGNQPVEQSNEHDFRYRNPDFHDPYATDLVLGGPLPGHEQRQEREKLSYPRRVASFFCNPVQTCYTDTVQSEALHRSLCFGAIDGMLTGSGIVATFWGMQLLPPESPQAAILHIVVVIFCASACFADAVCMALGHVWTAHVLASAHAREREEARKELEYSRADAKGQLVDMLLAKGMLKIDAMSLADTLEGYPDLFLAAVMGESLANATVRSEQQRFATAAAEAAAAASSGALADDDEAAAMQSYPSYGSLMDVVMDPEAIAVRASTSEARKESFFMMLGFSAFAIIPSLLFQWVPTFLNDSKSNTSIHPTSVIVALLAAIMGLLGIWKSYFLDSNWLLFSTEAILVLVLCLSSAYLMGSGLRMAFLPEGVELHVSFSHFDLGSY